MKDILRKVRFQPYRKSMGPVFRLTTWDTNRKDYMGKWLLGYSLVMVESFAVCGRKHTVLFEGEDFGCSSLHAVDSDATITAIMSFLTLRPGDTDRDYFAGYTQAQLDYCAQHAEALSCEVEHRFPEDQ